VNQPDLILKVVARAWSDEQYARFDDLVDKVVAVTHGETRGAGFLFRSASSNMEINALNPDTPGTGMRPVYDAIMAWVRTEEGITTINKARDLTPEQFTPKTYKKRGNQVVIVQDQVQPGQGPLPKNMKLGNIIDLTEG